MESIERKLMITEYSEYPGPRYCDQGECSGEDFYHTRLNDAFFNAISNKQKLIVILDGTAGFASSFLDEAFGNLIFDYSIKTVKANLEIVSRQEPDWIQMITEEVYVDWEKRRIEKNFPKKTENHSAWYRLVEDKLSKQVWS